MSKATAGGAGGSPGRSTAVAEAPATYAEANTENEARNLGRALAAKWEASLTPAERAGVAGWKYEDAQVVNMDLRFGPGGLDGVSNKFGERDRARGLDAALNKASLPQNVVVWRGMWSQNVDFSDVKATVGYTFTDKGFAATSLLNSVTGTFGDAVFRLNLKKGTKAQYLDTPEAGRKNGWQHEVLLQRNQSFKVTKHLGYMDVRDHYGGSPTRVPVYELQLTD